jgi:hypothetical protein
MAGKTIKLPYLPIQSFREVTGGVGLIYPPACGPWLPPMSQKPIPDFTETELWVVRTTLKERYGKEIPIELAEAEVMLGGEAGLAWCPTLWWFAKGASFAIIKLGDKRYRPIFSYHPETQIGTGVDTYDEIGDAVVDVLQVESDHMRKQKQKLEELQAKVGNKPSSSNDSDDSLTPLFWGD